jgi:hypothetical protein
MQGFNAENKASYKTAANHRRPCVFQLIIAFTVPIFTHEEAMAV